MQIKVLTSIDPKHRAHRICKNEIYNIIDFKYK